MRTALQLRMKRNEGNVSGQESIFHQPQIAGKEREVELTKRRLMNFSTITMKTAKTKHLSSYVFDVAFFIIITSALGCARLDNPLVSRGRPFAIRLERLSLIPGTTTATIDVKEPELTELCSLLSQVECYQSKSGFNGPSPHPLLAYRLVMRFSDGIEAFYFLEDGSILNVNLKSEKRMKLRRLILDLACQMPTVRSAATKGDYTCLFR
jgi:hypothetical protein